MFLILVRFTMTSLRSTGTRSIFSGKNAGGGGGVFSIRVAMITRGYSNQLIAIKYRD